MNNIKPVAHIDLSVFANYIDPETHKVLKILKDHHIPTRIVGGAIRDMLLGNEPRDIDFVVDADPSEIVYLFEMYSIETDLTGISHGTVKAVFGYGENKNKIEVTSLAYRIVLIHDKPKIKFVDDWAIDAEMRDLSINSLSMDTNGDVFDYTGGYEDLKNHRIRMLGHTRDHVKEEPNEIMRYFRAVALFPNPILLKNDLKFIKDNAHLLKDESDDKRVIMNMITVLKSPNYKKIVKLMCKLGLNKYLPYLPC